MKKLILLLIFMQLGVVSMAQDLYKNMNAPIHERIQDLLSKLTIEEKICSAACHFSWNRAHGD